jgi:hypothetical protein
MLGLGLSGAAHQRTIVITFDVRGAAGTIPSSINRAGAITGYYWDASDAYHGFLRAPNGRITTFDAPGAGPGEGEGTFPMSINSNGTVVGYVQDTDMLTHGFSRSVDGRITTFDVPGAGTVVGTWEGTFPTNNNEAGAIAGFYADVSWGIHGFLRAPNGRITTLDVPGAASTAAISINPVGAIAGDYWDANGVAHGFLRAPNGRITPFDAPGAGTSSNVGMDVGTEVDWCCSFGFLALNPTGAITGYAIDSDWGFHGFLRAPDGSFTEIAPAGAGTGYDLGTLPAGINPAGAITGYYLPESNVNHGFLRAPNGVITDIDVPGAGNGYHQGTIPSGINPSGMITGWWLDANDGAHGFLAIPIP